MFKAFTAKDLPRKFLWYFKQQTKPDLKIDFESFHFLQLILSK